jgi:hypothetical protein
MAASVRLIAAQSRAILAKEMRDRQTCIGCGKKSPETETNYTLISAQFGWRLTRFRTPAGAIVIEWRCPACWREYKKAKGDSPGTSSSDGREPAPSFRRSPPDSVEAPPPRSTDSTSQPPPPRPRYASSPPAPPLPPKTGRSSR